MAQTRSLRSIKGRRGFILAIVIVVIVGFFLLQLRIVSQAESFTESLGEKLTPVTSGELAVEEFEINVPVPILRITGGETGEIKVRYFAAGGLITGDKVIDLSESGVNFDSINVSGFFLPGEYDVRVFITEDVLLIEFTPS